MAIRAGKPGRLFLTRNFDRFAIEYARGSTQQVDFPGDAGRLRGFEKFWG
jgi:hypothetical protein